MRRGKTRGKAYGVVDMIPGRTTLFQVVPGTSSRPYDLIHSAGLQSCMPPFPPT